MVAIVVIGKKTSVRKAMLLRLVLSRIMKPLSWRDMWWKNLNVISSHEEIYHEEYVSNQKTPYQVDHVIDSFLKRQAPL